MVNYQIKNKLLFLIILFVISSCTKEIKEKYNIHENSKVSLDYSIHEDVGSYTFNEDMSFVVLEYVLFHNDKQVNDEEYSQKILFEIKKDSLIDESIRMSNIKLYSQVYSNLGMFRYLDLKGKVKINKIGENNYRLKVINEITGDIRYNDSVIKTETILIKDRELIFDKNRH